jgi:hypothetical protein
MSNVECPSGAGAWRQQFSRALVRLLKECHTNVLTPSPRSTWTFDIQYLLRLIVSQAHDFRGQPPSSSFQVAVILWGREVNRVNYFSGNITQSEIRIRELPANYIRHAGCCLSSASSFSAAPLESFDNLKSMFGIFLPG